MDAEKYNIVFDGSLRKGVTQDEAKASLTGLYGSELAEVMPLLFSGKRAVLKRGLSAEEADKVLASLQSAGLLAMKEASAPTFSLQEEAVSEGSETADSKNGEFARLKLFSFQGRLGRLRYFAWPLLAALICTAIMSLMTILLLDRAVDIALKASALSGGIISTAERDMFTLWQNVDMLWQNINLLILQNIDLLTAWQNIGFLWQDINLMFKSWRDFDPASALLPEIDSFFALWRNLTVLAIALTIALMVFIYSVVVRRMHDINLSGWWFFALVTLGIVSLVMVFVLPFIFIPVLLCVGLLKCLFWLTLLLWPGSARENNYGLPDSPKTRFLDIMLVVLLAIGISSNFALLGNLHGKIISFHEARR
ncbi:MAG: DUF805 domain-containing protein [Betaproteobacteria bacterium]|nr:DUF805 domain-containing protein [Betaproteobacteria bacterium]